MRPHGNRKVRPKRWSLANLFQSKDRAARAAGELRSSTQDRAPRSNERKARLRDRPSSRPERRTPRASGPGTWRIGLVAVVFFLFAGIVLVRAGQLQLVDHAKYEDVVERQATLSANITAKRGVIKDRHGAELAITVDVDSVFAEPRLIDAKDKRLLAHELGPILKMKPEQVLAKLESDRAFVYLKRRVDPAVAIKVRHMQVRGLGTAPEPKRFYANRGLGAHVLGFSGEDGAGRAGIEKQFDPLLRGKSYDVPGFRDALGQKVLSEGFVPHSVLEGADIVLTLDRQIQFAAETALQSAVSKAKAKGGVAIVLEAKSGEILALASAPTFNPNNLRGTGSDHHLNRAVSAVFEPGSTLKMVTVAGALEEGVIKVDDRIDCEGGSMKIGRRTIGDSHKGYEELTIAEILKVSSNVCAAKIGLELGRERLHRWLVAFGFGEKTGLELPGELRGLVRPAKDWREIALANIAFGQGLSATPLQVAQSAQVIANGGVRATPRIVKRVVEKTGHVVESPVVPPLRVIKPETARALTQMLQEVTRKGGTAESAAVPGFEVAGKTGTAQKIDPATRAYSHELYVSSFVGFVPAESPEVVILVMIDEPKGHYYGGTVAGPAFKEIAVAALAAREVFPDDPDARDVFLSAYQPPAPLEAPEMVDGDDVAQVSDMASVSASPEQALAQLSEDALLLLDEREVAARRASEAVPVTKPAPRTKGEKGRMPNFAGLKPHEVLNRSSEAMCDPVFSGTGRVVAQRPAPGAELALGARCEVELAPERGSERFGRRAAVRGSVR